MFCQVCAHQSGNAGVYGRCRMLYGFSRDRAVPYWWLWQQVDDHGVPVRAGMFSFPLCAMCSVSRMVSDAA